MEDSLNRIEHGDRHVRLSGRNVANLEQQAMERTEDEAASDDNLATIMGYVRVAVHLRHAFSDNWGMGIALKVR